MMCSVYVLSIDLRTIITFKFDWSHFPVLTIYVQNCILYLSNALVCILPACVAVILWKKTTSAYRTFDITALGHVYLHFPDTN